MLGTSPDLQALETVRELEKARIKATRANDAEALDHFLNESLIYITNVGSIYNKQAYLNAIRTHDLTYSPDFDVSETDHRVLGQ